MSEEHTKTVSKRTPGTTYAEEAESLREFLIKMLEEVKSRDLRAAGISVEQINEFFANENSKEHVLKIIADCDLAKKSCPDLWKGYWRDVD